MSRAEQAVLHVVTDDEVCRRADFLDLAASVVAAGGGALALHLRMPTADGLAVYEHAVALRAITDDAGARLVVNDRVDVALAAGADGVQLGARALPFPLVRRFTALAAGVSLHAGDSPPEGADWLLVGNVFETPSHPERAAGGLALVRGFATGGAPVIAIGGITPARVGEVARAGAAGIAVLGGVWTAADPAAAVRDYLNAWEQG